MLTPSNLTSSQIEAQMNFNEWVQNKESYVILDTETTGLRDAEIVDIAVIDLDGKVLFNSLVKPVNPIPYTATRIHGITNEMVKDSPTWLEVWEKLYPIIKNKTLLIYNDKFDIRMMFESFHPYDRYDTEDSILQLGNITSYCVMRTYAQLINSSKWVKLSEACGYETKHRALDDCIATLDVIRKNYRPEFTQDTLRMYQKYQYLDDQIRECSQQIQELANKQVELLKEQQKIEKQLNNKTKKAITKTLFLA
ncbi:MAG TPA: 3'-5' exonuclease [Sphingobacterium bovisgrunnientis]|nr:3'-5' exonuclease [Sphingobacterium bovisgrunnientis]